ncbi:MAG: AbrB/MazE/SpoVT family DNA-binding domain-containing protein [Nanoarchaeota archaeon]
MAIEVKLKRWGNSMAVIVPSSLIEQKNMKENDTLLIEVVKKADLSDIYGMIKKRKMSGQEFKDLAREGWE